MSIEIAKQIEVFEGIEIENRLMSAVNYRIEQRGRKLVIIIEPGTQVTPGLPLLIGLPKDGGN